MRSAWKTIILNIDELKYRDKRTKKKSRDILVSFAREGLIFSFTFTTEVLSSGIHKTYEQFNRYFNNNL